MDSCFTCKASLHLDWCLWYPQLHLGMCFVALFGVIVLIMVSLTSSLSESFTGTKVIVNIRQDLQLPTPPPPPRIIIIYWVTGKRAGIGGGELLWMTIIPLRVSRNIPCHFMVQLEIRSVAALAQENAVNIFIYVKQIYEVKKRKPSLIA